MTTPIKKGDLVDLWWANPFSQDANVQPGVTVLRTPGGSGDLFYFEDEKGETIAVNGNGLMFEGMRLVQRKEDREP